MAAPKVERFSSALIPLPAENVDTDQIVPARYLKVVVKSGLADALFHDWRFDEDGSKKTPPFVLDDPRFAGRSILIAGDNFGTGSSREHAPWFAIDPFAQKMLLAGLDELDFVRSKSADIEAHERAHPGTVNTKAAGAAQ